MAYRSWLVMMALAGLVACGGSRDRAPGTRTNNSTNNNNGGGVFDSGVSTQDAGTVGRDGGVPTSNLDRSKDVSELTPSELAELCTLAVQATGTEPTMCEGEITIEPTDYDECVQGGAPAGCTVGEYLDCLDSLDGDLCQFFQSPQCMVLFQCAE